jgi:hypothetical protein
VNVRTIAALGVACIATACVPWAEWAAAVEDPAAPGSGSPSAQIPIETPGGSAEIDVLDVVTYTLAALGLGPVARILAASRPLVAPLIMLILGKPKAKPAEPAPTA